MKIFFLRLEKINFFEYSKLNFAIIYFIQIYSCSWYCLAIINEKNGYFSWLKIYNLSEESQISKLIYANYLSINQLFSGGLNTYLLTKNEGNSNVKIKISVNEILFSSFGSLIGKAIVIFIIYILAKSIITNLRDSNLILRKYNNF